MYRAERLEEHFNVKVTTEARAALRAGATIEGMRGAQFARRVMELGLQVWRAEPVTAGGLERLAALRLRPPYRGLRPSVLLDFQMSPVMRSALHAGAAAERARIGFRADRDGTGP